MGDNPAGASHAPATLKAGSLHWLQVSALGIAIAISGNVSGWNYGLGVGGWGGMLLAALAMAVLFLCLTQSLAELAAALPDAGGFDGYVRRALGPTPAYLAGMSVAIALAVGAGLAISFSEAYVSAWLGFGGWPVKLAFLAIVMGLQLRGASEAVGLTVAVGVAALVILIAFCLFMAPGVPVGAFVQRRAGRHQKSSAARNCRGRPLHPLCAVSVSGGRTIRACRRRNARYGAQHAQGPGDGDRCRVRHRNVRAVDCDRRDRRGPARDRR